MAASIITKFSHFHYLKCGFISPLNINFVRGIKKHWDPKWRKERGEKVIKINLPDYDEMRKDAQLPANEIRLKMKEKGIAPPRGWSERPVVISSTGGIFEPYLPPEGDGKLSTLSLAGTKQKMEFLQKKGKSYMNMKKIRDFDENFDAHDFAVKAQDIYIDVHKYLAERNKDKLHELVTEKCFPEMTMLINEKTVRWKFIESLSIPRVVQIRCTDVISKENIFGQVTVRFHSKQTLAVYDRFGRLMQGSEVMPKDVLEYVVFENHLSNQYGAWRIHGKIIPDWLPPKEPIARTYFKPDMKEPPPPPGTPKSAEEKSEKSAELAPA
uniref:Large ribosomal subunit protein mL45 n=1 Tax=Strigamia maritima TaxID=126957 RepID=T1IZF5_STRMM